MKKTLLVAALVAGFAGMASASTVTMTGKVEAGYGMYQVGYGESRVEALSNDPEQYTSKSTESWNYVNAVGPILSAQLALKGSEDLDNGLKAIFELGFKAGYTFDDDHKNLIKSQGKKVYDAKVKYNSAVADAKKAYEDEDKSDEAKKKAAEKTRDTAIMNAGKEYAAVVEGINRARKLSNLGLKTAFVGISGEFGTVTFGQQDKVSYIDDRLFATLESDELLFKPFAKYEGTFGDVSVGVNLGSFDQYAGFGYSVETKSKTETSKLVTHKTESSAGYFAWSFPGLSVSAKYAHEQFEAGLTLSAAPKLTHLGAGLQMAYNFKPVKLTAGYAYSFKNMPAVKFDEDEVKASAAYTGAADDAAKKDILDKEKAKVDLVNSSRHSHAAFVGIDAEMEVGSNSSFNAGLIVDYAYKPVVGLVERAHYLGAELSLGYTYNLSKRTSFGASFTAEAGTVFSFDKDVSAKLVNVPSERSNLLQVSLTHKF